MQITVSQLTFWLKAVCFETSIGIIVYLSRCAFCQHHNFFGKRFKQGLVYTQLSSYQERIWFYPLLDQQKKKKNSSRRSCLFCCIFVLNFAFIYDVVYGFCPMLQTRFFFLLTKYQQLSLLLKIWTRTRLSSNRTQGILPLKTMGITPSFSSLLDLLQDCLFNS